MTILPLPAGTPRHPGGCIQPVLLRGRVDHIDGATGELLHRYSTVHEPGGVLRRGAQLGSGRPSPGRCVTGGSAVLPGGGAVGHQRADGPDCLWQVFTPADPALQWPPVLAAGDGVLYADPRR